jgi:hypothetical protein
VRPVRLRDRGRAQHRGQGERVALLNIQRKPELNATQNLISRALPITVSRLSDIRSHAPGGVDGLMTADDYGEEAAA